MPTKSAYLAEDFAPDSIRAAVRQMRGAFNRAHWRSYFAGGWRRPMPQLTTGIEMCLCTEQAYGIGDEFHGYEYVEPEGGCPFPHWRDPVIDGPTPYLGRWPWPCTCAYIYLCCGLIVDTPDAVQFLHEFGYDVGHSATGFIIHADCPQHGDDALVDGCLCRGEPGWYPGRPAAELCPLHGTHRHICPGVRFLGRSWRSEGCGWRCPKCGAEYTLTRAETEFGDHTTPYGVHPRTQCGPNFCDLLPPRPVMQWVRDDDTQTN